MMPPDTISLEFIARQQTLLLEEIKSTRAESREVRRTFSLISEYFSRQERRVSELRDDIESLLKVEIGGSIVNLETRLENQFELRIGAVEHRLKMVETKLEAIEGVQAQQSQQLQAIEGVQAQQSQQLRAIEDVQAQQSQKLDAILALLRKD